MVYFQTKISFFGTLDGLEMKVLVYFMVLWSVLRPFGISYGHMVYFGFV
jgi:hypothetical protein